MKKKSQWIEWVESFVIAALIAIVLRTFLFQIYKIPTKSMVPTLMPRDKIFVSKLTYGPNIPFTDKRIHGFRKPERLDVVVFIPPHEKVDPHTKKRKPYMKRKAYIKRLIGLPGDNVIIKKGNIYVNGKELVDARIAANYYYNLGN